MARTTENMPSIATILFRSVLYTFIIPSAVVAVIVGAFYIKSIIDANNTQTSMNEYLRNKYGQEFVVEKPKRKGGGIGIEGYMEAVAYPKNNEEVRFVVISSPYGSSDYYVGALCGPEESEIAFSL